MSARRCKHTAQIAETMSLEALSPELASHAEGCEPCGHELERRRGLASLTTRARRAFEQAGDLEPAAWSRVRAGIDAGLEADRSRGWRSWGFGLLAVVAGAAIVVFATRSPEPSSDHEMAGPTAKQGAGAELGPTQRPLTGPNGQPEPEPVRVALEPADGPDATPAPSAPKLLEVATASGEVSLEVGPGAMIAASTEGERYRLLGRHDLELAQGTRLRVRALDTGGAELDLIEGLASFDVNRAPGERLFRVHVDDVLIEVRGTFWSVERRSNAVVVSVERGRVAVMREGEEEVLVEAGERVVFPRLDQAARNTEDVRVGAPERRASPRAKRPKPERMVEVEVGHQAAKATPEQATADVEHLIPPILGAVRAGRCVQALSALDHVSRAVNGRVPRSALWLTAYCQRKLGNLESSRKLFARYGAMGPWAVPTGDELPALP